MKKLWIIHGIVKLVSLLIGGEHRLLAVTPVYVGWLDLEAESFDWWIAWSIVYNQEYILLNKKATE
jgi:hypothetical protein